MSSLLEDVLQHIATFYVELWLKPEVLVGWSAVGSKVGSGTGSGTGFLSGMSTVALVSMFAGVLVRVPAPASRSCPALTHLSAHRIVDSLSPTEYARQTPQWLGHSTARKAGRTQQI